MTGSLVLPPMPYKDLPVAQRTASDFRMVAAPHASDSLAKVFRSAFGPCGDMPDDFAAMLAQIDHKTTDPH
ncbi:MAG: hypothetical protein WC804_08240 [Sphingomonas sp.]|jgi:hypothetical protein|uniref:hypothetical protein n=1 Tax=Sphingomonas sp. TaxID=28214 RepID=UPI003568DB6C